MTDLPRLAALLDAYGAVPARWPEADREAALALLRRDPGAVQLLDQAGAIDDRLDAYTVPSPSPALLATVMAGLPVRPFRPFRPWWTALGAVAIGLGGIAAGSAATAALLPRAAPPGLHEDVTAFAGAPAVEDGG